MDWPVTARTQVAHVRETIADRELETWAVVDLSASLDFGTATCTKRDLAIAGLAAVSHLIVRGGNRLGAVATTGERVDRYPDRKSTRLNSSHANISYAVFCLKKKQISISLA